MATSGRPLRALAGLALLAAVPSLSWGGEPRARLTWYRDVLPLVRDRCQPCHQGGGVGPFQLLTYADAKANHKDMADAIASGYMPPWLPADGCKTFRDPRRLTTEEAQRIIAWAAQGAAEGSPADTPPPPGPSPSSAPEAELILASADEYAPRGPAGAEESRCFPLGPATLKARAVVEVSLQPGAPQQVRQATLYAVPESATRKLDRNDAAPGWACPDGPPAPDSLIVGLHAPGTQSTRYPSGTGVRVPAGMVYVLQVGYLKKEDGASRDRPGARLLQVDEVASAGTIALVRKSKFAIPGRSAGFRLAATLRLPVGGTVAGVLPRMYEHGRRIKVERKGDCLIDIPFWDLQLHQFYFLEAPSRMAMRAGEAVTLTCTWNNADPEKLTTDDAREQETCRAYLYLISG